MSQSADELRLLLRRLMWIQGSVTAAAAAGFLVAGGWAEALAAGYGGAVTMAAAWWMAARLRRAGELAYQDPARGSLVLYTGAAQRFVFMLLALALGMGLLRLDPLPLVVVFVLTQLSHIGAATGGRGRGSKKPGRPDQ